MEISGAFAAVVTPFSSDGAEVAERALRDLVDRVVDGGADGIIPCGGSGEFSALSHDERRRVVEIVVDQVGHRVPVFAQTGGLSTAEAQRHTEHAAAVGADGLMLAPPFYERLPHDAAAAYFSDVARTTDLPVMLYNSPGGTGLHMTTEFVVGLARENDTIRYIKDSSADPLLHAALVTGCSEDIATFCGEDILFADGLVLGATGLVAGSFSFMMPVYARMVAAARTGDLATAVGLWRETLPLVVCLATNPYTAAVKAACEILGHDLGPVRTPSPSLTPEARNRLEHRIGALDPSYFG